VEALASGEDAAAVIARHVARFGYADLPAAVVAATKSSILDTLGCILAGSGAPEAAPIVDLVADRAGRPAATVIGQGLRVPAESAVLANAATIHQYDFDDTHDTAICHPTSATLIPALALGEQIGGVGGRELITAVALGNDLVSRTALAIRGRLVDYVWFRAPVVGMFGASAAACKVAGASAEQVADAFGLVLPMIGGTLSSLQHSGSQVRAIRDGLSYRSAVLAAELALRGVRGDREVMEGPYGYYRAYFRGEYDRAQLVDDLGVRFEGANVSLKPWPAIRHLHRTLSCIADLQAEHRLAFDDIERVTVHVGRINADRCRLVEMGSIPALRMDLLANLPFVVGTMILQGGVPLAVYRDARLADDVIARAMPKVRVVQDDALDGAWTLEPAKVAIATRGGKTLHRERRIGKGHPEDPMSRAEQEAKFRDCASVARRPVPERVIASVLSGVDALETIADVRELTALLA